MSFLNSMTCTRQMHPWQSYMAAQNLPWKPFTLRSNSDLDINIRLFLPVQFSFILFSFESHNEGSVSGVHCDELFAGNGRTLVFFQLQREEWAFKLFCPDLMLYINVYISLSSTRTAWHFGEIMPEFSLLLFILDNLFASDGEGVLFTIYYA